MHDRIVRGKATGWLSCGVGIFEVRGLRGALGREPAVGNVRRAVPAEARPRAVAWCGAAEPFGGRARRGLRLAARAAGGAWARTVTIAGACCVCRHRKLGEISSG